VGCLVIAVCRSAATSLPGTPTIQSQKLHETPRIQRCSSRNRKIVSGALRRNGFCQCICFNLFKLLSTGLLEESRQSSLSSPNAKPRLSSRIRGGDICMLSHFCDPSTAMASGAFQRHLVVMLKPIWHCVSFGRTWHVIVRG
jgi:hypothetical protein